MIRIGKTFPNHPLIANMVEKGRTPVLSKVELEQLGYKIAIFPVTALLASVQAMTKVYEHFKDSGSSINNPVDLYDFGELSKLMGFEDVCAIAGAKAASALRARACRASRRSIGFPFLVAIGGIGAIELTQKRCPLHHAIRTTCAWLIVVPGFIEYFL